MKKNEVYIVNKNYVLGCIRYTYGSVAACCRELKISRQRLYQVFKTTYVKKNSCKIINQLTEKLGLMSLLTWETIELKKQGRKHERKKVERKL